MVCQADVGRLCDPGRHARRPRAVPDTIAPDTDMPQTSSPAQRPDAIFLTSCCATDPSGVSLNPPAASR